MRLALSYACASALSTRSLFPKLRFARSFSMSSSDAKKGFADTDGRYRRQVSSFRDVIEKGGKFEPEVGRYHLIVALACPWASRALILRKLKRMDEVKGLLPVTVVDSFLGDKGWSFVPYDTPKPSVPGTGNNIPGEESKKYLMEFYKQADPQYSARATVPVVWDNKLKTIVNNESSDMIRFLDTCFDEFLPQDVRGIELYPEKLRPQIDKLNEWVYPEINNGVYKSGFAENMDAYLENVHPLFKALERIDNLIGDKAYLVGDQVTEADVRLFTTIVRFDPVYVRVREADVSNCSTATLSVILSLSAVDGSRTCTAGSATCTGTTPPSYVCDPRSY